MFDGDGVSVSQSHQAIGWLDSVFQVRQEQKFLSSPKRLDRL